MEQSRSYLLGTRRTSKAVDNRKLLARLKKMQLETDRRTNAYKTESLGELQEFRRLQEQKIAELQLEKLHDDIFRIDKGMQNLADNIRVNNCRHEKLQKSVQEIEQCLESIKNALDKNKETDGEYACIDYIDFENKFRGSIELIKERQKKYVPYFIGCNNVVDIGCGRGEFLELLKEENIIAKGVDLYQPCVELCNKNGVNVLHMDGIEFLNQQAQVDGIFVSQVVEHISTQKLCELIEVAYKKLEKDKYLIIETPNPCSVSTFTNAFYMDPSHSKPVHPMMLQYILKKAGFVETNILFTEDSKYPLVIPRLTLKNESNAEEFNSAMEKISALLFGSQDYAIIAKR